jgi:hypothetical protein
MGFVALCTLAPAHSRAQDDAPASRSGDLGARVTRPARDESSLDRVLSLERQGDLDGALALLTQLESSDDASVASVAAARAAWLHARSEGNFAPLRALLAIQASAERSSSPAELSAFDDAAQAFPPGRARVEAHSFVVQACLRAACSRVATTAANRVLDDESASQNDKEIARSALRTIHDLGGTDGSQPDPALVASPRRVDDVLRVRSFASWITRLAVAGVSIPTMALVAAVLRRATRSSLLVGAQRVGMTCALIASGGAIARSFDPSVSLAPFVLLALGLFVVDRGWLAFRSVLALPPSRVTSWPVRWAMIAAALFSVLSVAVLSLACSDATLLERTLLREPR